MKTIKYFLFTAILGSILTLTNCDVDDNNQKVAIVNVGNTSNPFDTAFAIKFKKVGSDYKYDSRVPLRQIGGDYEKSHLIRISPTGRKTVAGLYAEISPANQQLDKIELMRLYESLLTYSQIHTVYLDELKQAIPTIPIELDTTVQSLKYGVGNVYWKDTSMAVVLIELTKDGSRSDHYVITYDVHNKKIVEGTIMDRGNWNDLYNNGPNVSTSFRFPNYKPLEYTSISYISPQERIYPMSNNGELKLKNGKKILDVPFSHTKHLQDVIIEDN
jgi:hypothetical protein